MRRSLLWFLWVLAGCEAATEEVSPGAGAPGVAADELRVPILRSPG
jgi:hypothetical protein